MREDELSLLALGVLALLLEVVVLLLQNLLFSFSLPLELLNLLVLVSLDSVKLLLQSVSLLLNSLDFLL